MRILVIRFGSIGDIVLTTPVLRLLRKSFPDADITYMTKSPFVQLLTPNPYVNRVMEFQSVLKARNFIKSHNVECIVDLHSSLRSRLVSMGHWKSKRLSVDKKNISKWLMVNRKAKIVVPHMAIRNMEVLRPLGITPDGLGLDFFLPKTVQNPITDPASSYVTWAIGGQHETKKLPLEKLEEIARRAPIKTYILGGKEDEDSGNLLASKYQNVINLCGKTSLHESAKAIQESLLLLTHDTGMMHIGAALNKPIFSVWGNTVPEFGMSPFLPTEDNKVFEVNDLDCRPCSKIGHKACPKGHFSCMAMQNTKDIIQSIDELAKSKMV